MTRLDLNESDPTVESLWLSVGGPGRRTVIVGVIYRPPATPTARTLNILRAELSGAIAIGKPVYVLGDFNINLLNLNGPGVRNFCAMVNDLSLHQLIDKPTHLHPIPTLLDLIVTNQTGLHDFVKILPEPVADHQPVLLCAPSQRQRRRPTTYTVRPWERTDWDALCLNLLCANWDPLYTASTVNNKLTELMDIWNAAVNTH